MVQNKNNNNTKKSNNSKNKKKAKNDKYKFMTFRLKRSTKDYISELAQEQNISKSKVIRNMISSKRKNFAPIKVDDKQLNKIVKALNKVFNAVNGLKPNIYRNGGNLNQIARTLSTNAKNGKKLTITSALFNAGYRYSVDEDKLNKVADNANSTMNKAIKLLEKEVNQNDSKKNGHK